MTKTVRLFVYGTLKMGYGNNRLLSKAKFIEDYTTGPYYDIASVSQGGGFPIMYPGKFSIKGEIYEVDEDTLKNCDALEGVPHMYDRKYLVNSSVWYYEWQGRSRGYPDLVHTSEDGTTKEWKR